MFFIDFHQLCKTNHKADKSFLKTISHSKEDTDLLQKYLPKELEKKKSPILASQMYFKQKNDPNVV